MRDPQIRVTPRIAVLWCLLAVSIFPAPALAAEGLVLFPNPVHLVILIIVFALLVIPVNALVFKPIFRVLDARMKRTEGARARAAELQKQADAMLSRYRESIRELREEAEQDRRAHLEEVRGEQAELSAQAREEAGRVVGRGREELTGWVTEARDGLGANAERLARSAAGRVLGRELT